MAIQTPKGTKDIFLREASEWHRLEERFRKICLRYGFEEIRTPTIEYTELFARGIGDATDVVEKQMYTFEDYGGRSISLKPEGTAGVVRAYLENKLYAGIRPMKLWYETPCFRYEKPQGGRLREFHQFGVEVFGADDMLADAEVIALANDFLQGLGIKGITLNINSLGCPKCRAVYRKELSDYLHKHIDELCETCKNRLERNPLRVLDCKSPICQGIAAGAPVILDFLCDDCGEDFEALQKNLKAMNVSFEIDPHIVRGLDYYTKTAFEFVSDRLGAQGTVCGGGRYDHLVAEIAGAKEGSELDISGVGFGLGIERLLLALEASGVQTQEESTPDVLCVFLSENAKEEVLGLAADLRGQGFTALIDAVGRNMKGQFKYADKLGVRYCLVVGDDELATGEVTVKNMTTGEQQRVVKTEAVDVIRAKM